MNKNELREIIVRVVDALRQEASEDANSPHTACVFGDESEPCDTVTTLYAVGEEG
jgi:hypothetical protein